MQLTRHTLRLGALGLLLFPILAGCGGGGGGGNGNPGTGTTGIGVNSGVNSGNNSSSQNPVTASGTLPNGLTGTLTENSATVSVGGTVTYTLTLANNTAGAITVQAPSATAPPVYLVVNDASGTAVYNPMPAPPLTTVTLATGQSLSQSVPVQLPGVAGNYTAKANFSLSDGTANTVVGPLTVTAQ